MVLKSALIILGLTLLNQCQSAQFSKVFNRGKRDREPTRAEIEIQSKKDNPHLKKNIISIGFNCGVRVNFEKNYFLSQKYETHFFDWALSDFESVLTILNLEEDRAKRFFSVDNIELIDSYSYIYGGEFKGPPDVHGGKFKSLSGMQFIYDIHKEKDLDIEKKAFSERYHSRYERLINAVKTKETIYFVRWFNEPTLDEVDRFFAALEKLSVGHKHVLVTVLNKPPTLDFASKSWSLKYKTFNLKDYPPTAEPAADGGGASQSHLDWKIVFNWIDNHHGKGEEWNPSNQISLDDDSMRNQLICR